MIRRQPGVSTQVGISVENPEEILIVNTLNIIVVAAVVELWLLFPEVSSLIDEKISAPLRLHKTCVPLFYVEIILDWISP